MKHEMKVRLGTAFVAAVVGFAAAPKVLDGMVNLVRLAQKICDRVVKETL
jgi:hypothetical protein